MRIRQLALNAFLILLLFVPASLFSISLDEIIASAYSFSDTMKSYELDRKNTELSLHMAEAKDQLGISISSGEISATYNPKNGSYEYRTTGPEAELTLPENKTVITIGTGALSYQADSPYYTVSPSLNVSRSFLIGESSDNRSSLINRQTSLLGNSSYQNNLIQFENSILNAVRNLLTNEKNINETMRSIVIQEKAINDALTLKLLSKESVAYQEQQNSLERLKSTLVSLESNQSLLESQYKQLTSLSWEGIPSIREPKLEFVRNPGESMQVALKALALKLAQEDLTLAQAEQTNKNLRVSAGGKYESSFLSSSTGDITTNSITGSVSAQYLAKNYSFGAGLVGKYNIESSSFTPTLTVAGSWNNNGTTANETLNIQKLENSVALATYAYNDALQDYLSTASSLEGQIAAWKLEHALVQNSMVYHENVLEQQQALFAKGLTTSSSVDNARFTVAQDAYEQALSLLKGLSLENSIRSLQIQGR